MEDNIGFSVKSHMPYQYNKTQDNIQHTVNPQKMAGFMILFKNSSNECFGFGIKNLN